MRKQALMVAPVALLIAGGLGMYTTHLCGCAHPFAVLIGPLQPLSLSDEAILQRLRAKLPAGISRNDAEERLRGSLGSAYEQYCSSGRTKSIDCEATLETDLFGMRKTGLTVAVLLDPPDRVSSVRISRFSRIEWK